MNVVVDDYVDDDDDGVVVVVGGVVVGVGGGGGADLTMTNSFFEMTSRKTTMTFELRRQQTYHRP